MNDAESRKLMTAMIRGLGAMLIENAETVAEYGMMALKHGGPEEVAAAGAVASAGPLPVSTHQSPVLGLYTLVQHRADASNPVELVVRVTNYADAPDGRYHVAVQPEGAGDKKVEPWVLEWDPKRGAYIRHSGPLFDAAVYRVDLVEDKDPSSG